MAGQQTPLYIVHLRYRTDRINEAYQSGLKQLAETTSGTATFCRSSGEIPEAIAKVLSTIGAHYSVTLAVPEWAGKNVQVGLDAEGGSRTLNYRTHFSLQGR